MKTPKCAALRFEHDPHELSTFRKVFPDDVRIELVIFLGYKNFFTLKYNCNHNYEKGLLLTVMSCFLRRIFTACMKVLYLEGIKVVGFFFIYVQINTVEVKQTVRQFIASENLNFYSILFEIFLELIYLTIGF